MTSTTTILQPQPPRARPSNTQRLVLHPWRDGFERTLKLLEERDRKDVMAVDIVFVYDDEIEYSVLTDEEIISLFEYMGHNLPNLESVIVRGVVDLSSPNHHKQHDATSSLSSSAIPPIQALTGLLLGQQNRLQYLTLVGLRLICDNYDVNGFQEALRIHSTLHSFAMKDCFFSKKVHLDRIKEALATRRSGMKHCDLESNMVLEDAMASKDEEPKSFFSLCLEPGRSFCCCM